MSTSRGGSSDDSGSGSVGYEAEPTERGERLIWLEAAMADRLGPMREAGERQANRNCCRFEGRRSRPLTFSLSQARPRTRQRGRKRPWTALTGSAASQGQTKAPPTGKSGVRNRTPVRPGSSPARFSGRRAHRPRPPPPARALRARRSKLLLAAAVAPDDARSERRGAANGARVEAEVTRFRLGSIDRHQYGRAAIALGGGRERIV